MGFFRNDLPFRWRKISGFFDSLKRPRENPGPFVITIVIICYILFPLFNWTFPPGPPYNMPCEIIRGPAPFR